MFKESFKARGEELELLVSREVHEKEVPLLVSPQLLREYGCGQIDVASIVSKGREHIVKIYEVKQGPFISKKQVSRLRSAGMVIGSILNCGVTLELAFKKSFC